MANSHFQFKQFTIHQDRCAMKVTTDSCLFGAWVANEVRSRKPGALNAFDIGGGTGLLSLMIAQANPQVYVDYIEIDNNAFLQAKENVSRSPFAKKVNLVHEDVLNESSQRKYDVIICNPPFYENELKSGKNARNIAHHDDGLTVEQLLPAIKERMLAHSNFFLLLPYKRKTEIESLFKKNNLFPTQIISVKQTIDHDYFRLMIEGSLYGDFPPKISELSIRDDKDQYTIAFTKLLKHYYLNF